MALEGEETLFEFGQGREMVWRENLSLNDGEIDLDLIEPTGVDRRVDESGIRPFFTQTVGGFLTSVSGAVVHDPKDRLADLYGSWLMTSVTSRSTGVIPLFTSQRPKSLARWTSHGAK